MFKRFLITTAPVALLAGAALGVAAPAQAQGVGIEISPSGPRIYQERPVVERRQQRRVIVEDEEECRTVIERRRNRFGERVETRKRVCG